MWLLRGVKKIVLLKVTHVFVLSFCLHVSEVLQPGVNSSGAVKCGVGILSSELHPWLPLTRSRGVQLEGFGPAIKGSVPEIMTGTKLAFGWRKQPHFCVEEQMSGTRNSWVATGSIPRHLLQGWDDRQLKEMTVWRQIVDISMWSLWESEWILGRRRQHVSVHFAIWFISFTLVSSSHLGDHIQENKILQKHF